MIHAVPCGEEWHPKPYSIQQDLCTALSWSCSLNTTVTHYTSLSWPASHLQVGGLKKAFASCSATLREQWILSRGRSIWTSTLGFEPEDTKSRSQKLSLQKHSLVQWNHHSTGHILLIRKPRLVISSTVPTEGSSRTVDGIEETLPGCSVCSRQKIKFLW